MINTKIKTFLFLICITLFSESCKKIDELTKFDIDYTTSVTIPSNGIIALPLDILTPDIESNSEAEFAVNDTRKDKIEQINLKEMKLKITSPSSQRFDFLDSISVSIIADGLFETQIAYKYDIPDNIGNELVMDVNNSQDLKEYIKKDKFKLKVRTITDKLLTQNVNVEVYCIFFVDAKVLGQ
jgi:hypothetical protein